MIAYTSSPIYNMQFKGGITSIALIENEIIVVLMCDNHESENVFG